MLWQPIDFEYLGYSINSHLNLGDWTYCEHGNQPLHHWKVLQATFHPRYQTLAANERKLLCVHELYNRMHCVCFLQGASMLFDNVCASVTNRCWQASVEVSGLGHEDQLVGWDAKDLVIVRLGSFQQYGLSEVRFLGIRRGDGVDDGTVINCPLQRRGPAHKESQPHVRDAAILHMEEAWRA